MKAAKPCEAIDMYLHERDFKAALRVAEGHDPVAINTVLQAQGRAAFQAGDFKEAESLLRSDAAQVLVQLFTDAKMENDARRIVVMCSGLVHS